jgi:DNA-binding GntR family transcriptional regulator
MRNPPPDKQRTLFHGSVPLHHQIQRLLRGKIQSAEWRVGDRVPTEIEFARQFRVSRTTIRQALRALEKDGLITRGRARGTFVASQQPLAARPAVIRSPLLNYEAAVEVIEIRKVAAPTHVAEFLEVDRGYPVLRFVRVEYVDDAAIAALFNYMSVELGRKITRAELGKHSMLECIVKHAAVPPGRVHQSIEARMPDENVAPLLGIDLTEPTLLWRVRLSDRRGVPLQLCDMFYRGDRCRYETETPFSVTQPRATMAIPRNRARNTDGAERTSPRVPRTARAR